MSGKAVFASAKKPFRDCDDPNVVAAYELGLVSGRGDGIFDPDASIKRQDLCVMLYNILGAAGIDAPAIAGDACVEDYPDVPEISDYAVNAMITMVDYTIVNGISAADEATLLAPNDRRPHRRRCHIQPEAGRRERLVNRAEPARGYQALSWTLSRRRNLLTQSV